MMATTRKVQSKKRILMWIIIGLVTALIIVGAGLLLVVHSIIGPAPAPLQLLPLSPAPQHVSEASLEGTWIASHGSVAGFRIPESFLIQRGTIVGRTSAVTGSLLIAHQEISSASFQVDLSKITVPVGGKPNASFFQLLETSQYPHATLTLARPIVFSAIPTNGQTISSQATARLSMRGVTHPVTLTLKACSNGSVLEAVGSASVLVSEWGIQSPFAVQHDALIEFLVVLHRG
jgi:polyisoprenoid-binding protein YceI